MFRNGMCVIVVAETMVVTVGNDDMTFNALCDSKDNEVPGGKARWLEVIDGATGGEGEFF